MKQALHPVLRPIQLQVHIPGSKSISNRALLLAALANGVSEIHNVHISEDSRNFVKALADLGVSIQFDEELRKVVVGGCSGQFLNKHCALWCGDSGPLARFALAACAALSGAYYFDGTVSLRKRSMSSLLNVLTSQGAICIPNDSDRLPLILVSANGLRGGKVFMGGSKTGQAVSALLMIAPFLQSSLILHVEYLLNRAYVDLTCSVMSEFGVKVETLGQNNFSVAQTQKYLACDYHVEPDLSTAAYFFAAAAVTGGEVTIQAIQRQAIRQADIGLLSILEQMGCEVSEQNAGLTVKGPAYLRGAEVSLAACPDLFMTVAAIAPFAETVTTLMDIKPAHFKASERLNEMRKGLERLGIKTETGPDWFKIHPSKPHGGIIQSHQDHRIAMAFSIIALRVPDIIIGGAECVAKSCPEFLQLWESL